MIPIDAPMIRQAPGAPIKASNPMSYTYDDAHYEVPPMALSYGAPCMVEASFPKGTMVRWYKTEQTYDHITAVVLETDGRIKDVTRNVIFDTVKEWMDNLNGGCFYINGRNSMDESMQKKKTEKANVLRAALKEERISFMLRKKLAALDEKAHASAAARAQKHMELMVRRKNAAAIKIAETTVRAQQALDRKAQELKKKAHAMLASKTARISEKMEKMLQDSMHWNRNVERYYSIQLEKKKAKIVAEAKAAFAQ